VSEIVVHVQAVGAVDNDAVADEMNAHDNAETPLYGLTDEEVMTLDAAPLVASSSKVLSLAAATVSTWMTSTVAVGDVAVADGVKAGAGSVMSRLGHSVEQNVVASVRVPLGTSWATTRGFSVVGTRAGGSASPADAVTILAVSELTITELLVADVAGDAGDDDNLDVHSRGIVMVDMVTDAGTRSKVSMGAARAIAGASPMAGTRAKGSASPADARASSAVAVTGAVTQPTVMSIDR